MRRAARDLEDWVPVRVSLGVLQATGLDVPRFFLLMAGAGLDARIIRDLNPGLKRVMGKFAYWVTAFAQFGATLESFEVRLGSTVRTAGFALASRVRNYGGDLEIAMGASLMDDTFEVVVFEGTFPLRYFVYLGAVALKRLNTVRGVTIVKAEKLELAAPEGNAVELQVDGELAGCLPARISIAPAALTLLVPPQFLHAARDRAWITSRIPSPA
jgi:diacylglycerol kinase family enzyme